MTNEPKTTAERDYLPLPDREALIDIIAQGLQGTYHCNRAWSAWGCGTMGEGDFSPVDESDTPAEIADAILAHLAASPTAQAAPAAVAGPSEETCRTCQGNGEIVTNWERYKHPLPGDVGDEAVDECQDCDGQGVVEAAPQPPVAAQEPWYGHQFKEVQRGVWRCTCGKQLKEQPCTNGTPNTSSLPPDAAKPDATQMRGDGSLEPGALVSSIQAESSPDTHPAPQQAAPIDMVLHCPKCGLQHIDAAEEVPGMPIFKSAATPDHPHRMEQVGTYTGQGEWKNPPHRSHLCHGCGHIWRPADVPTNGAAAVKTKGKADSPTATPAAPVAEGDALPDEDVRELAAIGRAVNRAAIELPPGARIQIELERDAGTAYWMDDAKGAWRHIEGGGELFSVQINAAIDAARAKAKEENHD